MAHPILENIERNALNYIENIETSLALIKKMIKEKRHHYFFSVIDETQTMEVNINNLNHQMKLLSSNHYLTKI